MHHCTFPRWLITWIKRKWEEFGLDSVTLSTYEFLISYPDPINPNKIYLYDDQNRKVILFCASILFISVTKLCVNLCRRVH